MDTLVLFFFTTTDNKSRATTKKIIAIDAGNSGIVGEASKLHREGVEFRLVGEAVTVEVESISAVYSVVAAY